MVGVITKTDIVSQIGRCGADGCSARVDTIMPREVFSCRANEWLQDVWTAIKERDLQRIPVLGEDSKPIGILYSRDVLQGLLGEVEDEETLLRGMDESTVAAQKILPPTLLGFVVFKHEILGDGALGDTSMIAFSVALQLNYFKC